MLKIVYPICCGLDVHKSVIFACVASTDGKGITSYNHHRFSTFTKGLRELAEWLKIHSCSDVCMESTGKYWIPVFNILEVSCNVVLAHPKYVNMDHRQGGRRDSVSISPMGKVMSVIERLMKQKEQINENKNTLVSDTLEKGGDITSISSQLEVYEKQLKNIDKSIADAMTQEMKAKNEEAKSDAKPEPKTKEDVENARAFNIISMSQDMNEIKFFSSVKAKIDGDARILESEIELDKSRAGSSEGARNMIAKKEASLDEMQHQSSDLSATIGKKLASTIETVVENNMDVMIADDDKKDTKEVDVPTSDYEEDVDL